MPGNPVYSYVEVVLSEVDRARGWVLYEGKKIKFNPLTVARTITFPIIRRLTDFSSLEPVSVEYINTEGETMRQDNLVDWLGAFDDFEKDLLVDSLNLMGVQVHLGSLAFVSRKVAIKALEESLAGSGYEHYNLMIKKIEVEPEWIDITTISDPFKTEMHVITGEKRHTSWDIFDNAINFAGGYKTPKGLK